MSNVEEDIKLKEISERFNNGTETLEDIMNYCRNYEIKFENGLELRVVEKRYFDKLVEKIKKLEYENKTLKNFTSAIFNENIEKEFIPVEKVKDYLKEEQERYEVYKKESKTNENLKLGMYKHLGAKNMCKKILGIEKNIATLD